MFDSNEFESEFLAGVGRDSRGLEDMATCVATSQQDVTYSLQCVASDQERWVRKAGEPFFEVVMTVSTFRKSSVEQFLKQHRNRAIVVQVGPAEMPMGTTRDSASKTTTSTWERIKAGMSHVEAERTREWQDGTWADSTTMTTGAIAFPVFGGRAAVAVNATATSYAVATQQVVYFGVWRANTPIPMTVNAPVRYAVEDDRLYVIGEDGKKYSLKLTKKVLRPGDR